MQKIKTKFIETENSSFRILLENQYRLKLTYTTITEDKKEYVY